MRDFPGCVAFYESKSRVRSCFPSRCENGAQGGMVIVLIHSVKVQSLVLGATLRGTPSLKREFQKFNAKELLLFVKISKLCHRIYVHCMSG